MTKGNDAILDFILLNTSPTEYKNPSSYLFKAIRLRDPILVKKMIEWGIDVYSIDEQGLYLSRI